jgi:hypothetical protein
MERRILQEDRLARPELYAFYDSGGFDRAADAATAVCATGMLLMGALVVSIPTIWQESIPLWHMLLFVDLPVTLHAGLVASCFFAHRMTSYDAALGWHAIIPAGFALAAHVSGHFSRDTFIAEVFVVAAMALTTFKNINDHDSQTRFTTKGNTTINYLIVITMAVLLILFAPTTARLEAGVLYFEPAPWHWLTKSIVILAWQQMMIMTSNKTILVERADEIESIDAGAPFQIS